MGGETNGWLEAMRKKWETQGNAADADGDSTVTAESRGASR